MKYLPLLLTLLCLSSPVFADSPQLPILIVSDSGYTWMIQGDDGTPQVYKFSQVIVIGKPVTVPTVPTASEFGLAEQTPTWLSAVPSTAKAEIPAIKKAFSDTAAMAGTLKTTGEVEAVMKALLGSTIKDKTSWATFGIALNTELIALQKKSKIVTAADYGRALTEVAKSLQ